MRAKARVTFMKTNYPAYIKMFESGELNKRIDLAFKILENCHLCPRACGVNRTKGELGFCQSGLNPIVASYNIHNGEEPPISGENGSGTIFFTHCTMRCVFCQNYPISQLGTGKEVTTEELADMYLWLQDRKAHNINFVTSTHFIPQILASLKIAIEKGFRLPLVLNSSGYERVETLKLLQDVIDIYLPDAKYFSEEMAKKYSNALDYVKYNQEALKEMFRQVGNLECDENGIAIRGLIIRHLVLPENISDTEKVLQFIANNISQDVYISLMSQYFPANKAVDIIPVNRKITKKEYQFAVKAFKKAGLKNGWIQPI